MDDRREGILWKKNWLGKWKYSEIIFSSAALSTINVISEMWK
jgi:hypothetical protein